MPVTSLRMPFAQPPEVAICGAWTTACLEAKPKPATPLKQRHITDALTWPNRNPTWQC